MSAVVYWLLDADDNVIYVGCTAHIGARMAAHASTKDWWPSVDSVAYSTYMLRSEALEVEREDIKTLQPRHNIAERTVWSKTPGQLVRQGRLHTGLSRERLAAKANVSVSTIARLELSDRIPSLRILATICELIAVPIVDVAMAQKRIREPAA